MVRTWWLYVLLKIHQTWFTRRGLSLSSQWNQEFLDLRSSCNWHNPVVLLMSLNYDLVDRTCACEYYTRNDGKHQTLMLGPSQVDSVWSEIRALIEHREVTEVWQYYISPWDWLPIWSLCNGQAWLKTWIHDSVSAQHLLLAKLQALFSSFSHWSQGSWNVVSLCIHFGC